MTSLYAYLTRAGMRHRIRHLKHQLAACEHDRARLAAELADARAQNAAMQTTLSELVADYRDLTTAALAGTTRSVQVNVTKHHIPAPADDPAWVPGEATVETALMALRAATYGADGIGPVVPVRPLPARGGGQ